MKMYKNLTGQYWYEPGGFANSKTPEVVVQAAVNAFYRNPGLAGLTPKEIHINENQHHLFPPQIVVNTPDRILILPVIPNIATQRGHVWVCCPDGATEEVLA